MSNLSKRVGKLEGMQNPCETKIVWVEEYRTKPAQDAWIERYRNNNAFADNVEVTFVRWMPLEE